MSPLLDEFIPSKSSAAAKSPFHGCPNYPLGVRPTAWRNLPRSCHGPVRQTEFHHHLPALARAVRPPSTNPEVYHVASESARPLDQGPCPARYSPCTPSRAPTTFPPAPSDRRRLTDPSQTRRAPVDITARSPASRTATDSWSIYEGWWVSGGGGEGWGGGRNPGSIRSSLVCLIRASASRLARTVRPSGPRVHGRLVL